MVHVLLCGIHHFILSKLIFLLVNVITPCRQYTKVGFQETCNKAAVWSRDDALSLKNTSIRSVGPQTFHDNDDDDKR